MGAQPVSTVEDAIQTYEQTHAETTNKESIIWLPLDLTTPRVVSKSANIHLSSEKRLQILGKYPFVGYRHSEQVLKYIVNNAARNASPP